MLEVAAQDWQGGTTKLSGSQLLPHYYACYPQGLAIFLMVQNGWKGSSHHITAQVQRMVKKAIFPFFLLLFFF